MKLLTAASGERRVPSSASSASSGVTSALAPCAVSQHSAEEAEGKTARQPFIIIKTSTQQQNSGKARVS